jgi:lipopolysaccharide export system protein LptA
MSWPTRNRTKISQPVKNSSILAIVFCIVLTGIVSAQQSPTAKPKQTKSPTTRTTASPTPKSSASQADKSNKEKKPNDVLGGQNQNKGPTEITARDEVQFDGQSRTGVFIGNVKVVDPDFTMTADKLTVHMAKQEEGGGLSSAEADGNVIIVHANEAKNANGGTSPAASAAPTPVPKPTTSLTLADLPDPTPQPSATPPLVLSTGRAQKALYDAKDQSMTLIGWPQITQGVNTHISTEEGTRMILYRDGRLKTIGGSRTIIQDKSDANKAVPPK